MSANQTGLTLLSASLLVSLTSACGGSLPAGDPAHRSNALEGPVLERPVVTQVTAGQNHTCALVEKQGGAVYCFGSDYVERPSGIYLVHHYNPYPVPWLQSLVTQIAAGPHFTCALKDGKVYCFGSNQFGEVGDGTRSPRFATDGLVPVKMYNPQTGQPEILRNVKELSTGYFHVCAQTYSDEVYCWGSAYDGQLGIGGPYTQANNPYPTVCDQYWSDGQVRSCKYALRVGGLAGVVSVVAGGIHTCAVVQPLVAEGQVSQGPGVQCFGRNIDGRLGTGDTTNRYGAGSWVLNPAGTAPLGGVESVAAGGQASCAIQNSGRVLCWGSDYKGQLGNGPSPEYDYKTLPVQALGLVSGVTSLTPAQDALTLGAVHNGAAVFWGYNYYCQAGQGTRPAQVDYVEAPTPVPGLSSGVVSVVSGGTGHACALLVDGRLKCWGDGTFGQLGDGRSHVQCGGPTDVVWN